jgi:hypothetical protein
MRVLLIVLVVLSVIAENPGLITNVKIDFINTFKDQEFTKVMEGFKNIPIPDQSIDELSTYGGVMSIENNDPANVALNFAPPSTLGVNVMNTVINVKMNWKFKKSILSFSGQAMASGPVTIAMDMNLGSQYKEGTVVPQIDVSNINLDINKGSFDVKVHADYVPDFVLDAITSLFHGKIMDVVIDEVRN